MFAAALFAVLAALSGHWLVTDGIPLLMRLWYTRHIPEPAPHKIWLLGHVPELLAKPLNSFRVFQHWAKQQGPIYRMRFLWRPVLVVSDPDMYQPLLRAGPHKLQKYTVPYRMFEMFSTPPRPNILSSQESSQWKSVRRAAVSALTMSNLRLCFPHIVSVTQRLIDSLVAAGPSAVHDIDLAAQQVTVDIIGLAAFDRDLQATLSRSNGQHVAKGKDTVSSNVHHQQHQAAAITAQDKSSSICSGPEGHWLLAYLSKHNGLPPIDLYRGSGCGISGRGGEVLDVMRHLVVAMQQRNNPLNRWFPWRKAYRNMRYYAYRMSSLVVDLLCDMDRHPPPPHTLGAHLMNCRHVDTGEPLERLQIASELGLMWGAGFETTAHSICWTLLLVSSHPEVESAVVSELNSLGLLVTPENPTPQTMKWEHLAQLKYLTAVINESMRLFPVVSSGTIRITHRPITLGGYYVPAGQPILIPFWTIHRNPNIWDDPESFKPERWLSRDTPAAAEAATGPSVVADDRSAAAALSGSASTAGSSEHILSELSSEDEYVNVSAERSDTLGSRDQDTSAAKNTAAAGGGGGGAGDVTSKVQQPVGQQKQSNAMTNGGLELKDPTIGRRGFLPFSEGSRNCVGQALALVELKAVLAMMIAAFHFDLAPHMGGYKAVEDDARQAVTLRPEHEVMMTARHRSIKQEL